MHALLSDNASREADAECAEFAECASKPADCNRQDTLLQRPVTKRGGKMLDSNVKSANSADCYIPHYPCP